MPLPRKFLAQIAREKELSSGETEVLVELFGSNQSRQEVADSLHISDSALSTRLGKIYGKFAIKGSGPVKLQKLQDYLIEQFQKWKPADNSQPDEAGNDIDALVQGVREQIKPLIKERCGTMRVLDMTQPIALTGEQGIYTNVNILEKITGRRRLGIEELLQGCDLEEFDRFGLSRVTEKRVPGLTAVERYSKLMVLGKPGAGKTTFLKYLAMQCIEGNFQADRIPVFITLKSFAEDEDQPNLLTCLEPLMAGAYTKTSNYSPLQFNAESCQSLIQQGKLLILLDGLDEVREEDTTRVLRQIREFSEQFYTNQFVVTCRIAAKEYTFQQFTEVEVADFDDEQIHTFVGNWFKCREPHNAEKLTQKLIERLEEHKPIKELATNPLLLTLLCLEFEELLEFPTNRAELYDRGLGVLLSKWDSSRRIERDQVYKRLSLKRKEDLLSQVAFKTFEQKDYFFKQKMVESYIADYISNLPDTKTDLEGLLLDSEAVLKSIEYQHGLLVERAKGIYSFSHLTFQEYFTARAITLDIHSSGLGLQILFAHIYDKRWREVFLLAFQMFSNADSLIRSLKYVIDISAGQHHDLQRFLDWSEKKAYETSSFNKPATVRAFYISLAMGTQIIDQSEPPWLPDWNIEEISNLLSSLDGIIGLNFYYCCAQGFIMGNFQANLDDSLALDFHLSHARAHASLIGRAAQLASNDSHEMDNEENEASLLKNLDDTNFWELSDSLVTALHYTSDTELEKLLEALNDRLPSTAYNQDYENWCKERSTSWSKELRELTMKYRRVDFDWSFDDKQWGLIRAYCYANHLLIDCLNSDCYVSREVRQEIEDTLLLPIAEIEKYKATKAAQQSD